MAIAWVTPTYSAGTYTAFSDAGGPTVIGSWTVDSGDVTTHRFRRVGKTIVVSWVLVTTTVGVTVPVANVLCLTIPLGMTAKRRTSNRIVVNDNGTIGAGYASVYAGSTVIECRLDSNAAWAASTNTTGLSGQIEFEVT